MLDKFVRMPHANQTEPNRKGLTATYVGSNRCKNCHKDAFDAWEKTRHHHATDTLEDVKKERPPLGRQFDPECMKCHVTGFEHLGGYDHPVPNLAAWVPGPRPILKPGELDAHNKKLRGVGCESCHGPGSEHVKAGGNGKLTPAEIQTINPYRPTDRERQLEDKKRTPPEEAEYQKLFTPRLDALGRMCIHCHDSENDVHWLKDGTANRWLGKTKNYLPIIHRTPPQKKNNGGPAPAKNDEPPRVNIGEPRPVVKGALGEKKK